MGVSTEEYARLASDVYLNLAEEHEVEGTGFKVLRKRDDNTRYGYFGAIYYNQATGEIVVAHRGTDRGNSWEVKIRDYITGPQMVLAGVNEQENHAYSVMQEAIAVGSKIQIASVTKNNIKTEAPSILFCPYAKNIEPRLGNGCNSPEIFDNIVLKLGVIYTESKFYPGG